MATILKFLATPLTPLIFVHELILQENALEGFAVADWINYMVELEKKYRVNVLTSLRNIVNS